MNKTIAYGLKIALVNFVILALVGSLMRFKIGFSFPYFIQKNLIDAHSHFAFYGWITTAIYFLIISDLNSRFPDLKLKKYFVVCVLNLIASYGMLVAFTYKDYYWLSIVFSSIALFCGWAYLYMLFMDSRKRKLSGVKWYLGGLFFAFISSIGIFSLSYLTATKQITKESLDISIYFYLHFQYNGFYIFSCIGLLINQLDRIGIRLKTKTHQKIYYAFFVGCILTYGLSVLWLKLPLWLYASTVSGALIQTFGSGFLFYFISKNWRQIKDSLSTLERFVLVYVGFAFSVKISLQLLSIFPSISKYAFDHRAVAIAYLHLILLMGISVFLVSKIIESGYFHFSKFGKQGFKVLLTLIFVNQVYLGLAAFSSIFFFRIPNLQLILFSFGVLIALTLSLILKELKFREK